MEYPIIDKRYYIYGLISFITLYTTIYYLDYVSVNMKQYHNKEMINQAISIGNKVLVTRKNYNMYLNNEKRAVQNKLKDEIYIIKYRSSKMKTYLLQQQASIFLNESVAMKRIDSITENFLRNKNKVY